MKELESNTKKGFIYLHKRIMDHPIWQNSEHFKLFSWMLLMAAWGAYTIKIDGKNYKMQKGQLITSRKEISEVMNLSLRTINRYLSLFEKKYDVIQIVKIGKMYAITIKNYEKYQKR